MLHNLIATAKKLDKLYELSNISRLGRLFTGFECNTKCNFCYYKTRLNESDTYDTILKRIDILDNLDYIDDIEFSGGESTIHNNFIDMLSYSKNKFNKISVITNGSMLFKKTFFRKCVEAGLNSILFSVHGDELSHNNATQSISYKRILKAISNAQSFNIPIRINTTLTGRINIDEYIDFLIKHNVSQLNLLPVNSWVDNISTIEYGSLQIDNIIDIISYKLPNCEINVRYIPYCFIKNNEYVRSSFDQIETDDWNLLTSGIEDCSIPTKPLQIDYFNEVIKNREPLYKSNECIKCKLYYKCDGIDDFSIDARQLIKPILDLK